jgi:putative addiction module component (TIGR02574 family)
MGSPVIQIDGLSPEERLDLLERVWNSLSSTPTRVPTSDAQRQELDRRLDALDRDLAAGGELGIPWNDVLMRVRGR